MKIIVFACTVLFLPVFLMASEGEVDLFATEHQRFVFSADLAIPQSEEGEKINSLIQEHTLLETPIAHNRIRESARKNWLARVLERKLQKRIAKVSLGSKTAEKPKKKKRKVYAGNWNCLFKALLGYLLLPLILVAFVDPFNFWWNSIELGADGIENSGSKTEYSGKGLAIAGLVLSVLGYVALFSLAIFFLLF